MTYKILVVDDEPDLEDLITQKFKNEIRTKEFEFGFAANGVEALDLLKADGEFDLVLTDINMPEMDGLTLLAKMKEMENPLLRSVIVSAYGDLENIRTAMNRGAYDFVVKPIDLNDLEITIRKCLDDLRLLKEAVKSRDRLVSIEKELGIARMIQTTILPRVFPERAEFDLCAEMIPAKEVGGDLYDFFFVDRYRLGVVIGDVSGKGVPAAMFMTVAKTLLKATALKGIPPDTCIETVNRILVDESLPSMFVTLFYGVLDTRNGLFEYAIPHFERQHARAGMQAGVARRRDQKRRVRFERSDAPARRHDLPLHGWHNRGDERGFRHVRSRAPSRLPAGKW